ncbi:MAG: hypothetical protein AB9891_13085 [Anaerolineaceae bacterium]
MITIGFAGTAKNTGKTTAALHMLGLVYNAGYGMALTSIGYDGENTDHVTGLPKPRYIGQAGMLIATAEKCLGYGDAQYEEEIRTGIHTLLGEIIVARVSRPGYVVLAGPNRRVDILPLIEILRGLETEIVFLDGALNRLAAMTMAEGIVLSTGAAFTENIDDIAAHAGAMESLFAYPQIPTLPGGLPNVVTWLAGIDEKVELPVGSVMDEAGMRMVSGWLSDGGAGVLVVPGIFEPLLFAAMLKTLPQDLNQKAFAFHSPLHLLATGNPEIWQSNMRMLAERGARIHYMAPVPLTFLTVNPFYPKYLQKTARYVPEFVDKVELLRAVRAVVTHTLVVDVLQPPLPDLLSKFKLPERMRKT